MAKKETKKEAVKDTVKSEPKGLETKGDVTKVKAKMQSKPEVLEKTITKVDLSKPQKTEETNADTKQETTDVVEDKQTEPLQEVVEETPQEQVAVQDDKPIIEEVTEEEVKEVAEEVVDAIQESEETGKPLPENVQKLVSFMEETGGDLQDYVKLNRDYSQDSDMDVLQDYYKNTKPHLSSDEIDFLMEDKFSFDKDVDDEKDIKRKKLALKEQVADAKAHLDRQKSKYYEEIKSGVKLTTEQQKAIDFFNRYNKESEENKKIAKTQKDTFNKKTNQVFNDKFKGFEYNVGEKKYRFNVSNAGEIKEQQSSINNFVKKFLNKNNVIDDAAGYHKSMFTAMNADAVANHFYEQGKADAIKDSVAKSKNINTDARKSHGVVEAGGLKVKVLGENSNDFKFKIKKKN